MASPRGAAPPCRGCRAGPPAWCPARAAPAPSIPIDPPQVDLGVLEVGAGLDQLELGVAVVHHRAQGVRAGRGAEAQLLAGEPELLARAAQLHLRHRHQLRRGQRGEERLLGGEGRRVLLLELRGLPLVGGGPGRALIGAALESGEEREAGREPEPLVVRGRLPEAAAAARRGVDAHRAVRLVRARVHRRQEGSAASAVAGHGPSARPGAPGPSRASICAARRRASAMVTRGRFWAGASPAAGAGCDTAGWAGCCAARPWTASARHAAAESKGRLVIVVSVTTL